MTKNCDVLLLVVGLFLYSHGTCDAQTTPVAQLLDLIPKVAERHTLQTTTEIKSLVPEVESWVVAQSTFESDATNADLLSLVRRILDVDININRALSQLYRQRAEFVAIEDQEIRTEAARSFLGCTTALIKLSGRIRYYTVDFFSEVGYEIESEPEDYDKLLDLYLEQRHAVGALTSLNYLLGTIADPTLPQLSDHLKGKILQLARVARDVRLLPLLAQILREENVGPELLIFVADTIRHIGVPQDAQDLGDQSVTPPIITAAKISSYLSRLEPIDLSESDRKRRADLIAWLDQRDQTGVEEEDYRFGLAVVRAGDWLLMKNPSPYNRFTNLHPGLYTHAGVVTTEVGEDGRRRFVVVDLPEIGNVIPATPVDKFVERTLDFVILRHENSGVSGTMGRIANSIIGNNSKFDLNFETDAIKSLKGTDLKGKRIEGYCAGLLLLCAQETDRPLENFFPLDEHPAKGNTLSNLAKLDVSMPNHFLSPTGPLFSPDTVVVYRCQTMYSPRRQIEQEIYDHFARQMRQGTLNPSLTWFEAMRLQLAEAAEKTPTLRSALTKATGINQNIDLVAAAKLGAVVQSLDAIAQEASREYSNTRNAFRLAAFDTLEDGTAGDKEFEGIVRRRRRHADLFVRWEAGIVTPRDLRIELVDYYIEEGCHRLDDRFFQTEEATATNARETQPEP
ncbi:MAG: hypothetical protein P8K78_05860 [Pirellulales bacterium]|nr:hypothetical protein [Pirellulales bacterium]